MMTIGHLGDRVINYNCIQRSETKRNKETATVVSYLNAVLTHTKSMLLLRISNHPIHIIIDRQIA